MLFKRFGNNKEARQNNSTHIRVEENKIVIKNFNQSEL
jgi:hypothetical protein